MDELKHRVAQRITAARDQAGLSQARAAELLGIDRPRLSGMENGERPVEVGMLGRLAQTYGVSVGFLVGTSDEVTVAPTMRLRSALAERLDGPEARAALGGFLTFAERYARLRAETRLEPAAPDVLRYDSSSATRKHAVEADALRLRDLWGLDDAPIGLGLFDLLENHGVGVYREALLEGKISGAFLEADGAGALVFVNARDWPYRQVFTAAHELAHLVYHRGGGVSFARDDSADENLANEFASAFLMPQSAIGRFLSLRPARDERLAAEDVIALHRAFGVSYHAMLVRLKRLGIVRAEQYEALAGERPVVLAARLGYSVSPWEFHYDASEVAPLERLGWLPRTFVGLVRGALEAGRLTERQAAKYLNLDFEDWVGLSEPASSDEAQLEHDREDAAFAVR